MEKKILIGVSLIAAICLFWVFSFIGQRDGRDFTRQAQLEISENNNFTEAITPLQVDLIANPGFATYENTATNYVLRPNHSGADRIEKMRVQIEQPTAPLPASTSCEQKRIDRLQTHDQPGFTIESMQVQRTGDWPEQYEIYYHRLRGNWSDLEATIHPTWEVDQQFFETVLKSHATHLESEASI